MRLKRPRPAIVPPDRTWLAFGPYSQGPEGTAVLEESWFFVGELNLLAGAKLPEAVSLNYGEVREAAARDLGRDDHAPSLVGIEPLDDAGHLALGWHPAIMARMA